MSPAATIDEPEAERAVMRTADDLFFRKGVGAVSMTDIRDASGVSMRRIYRLHRSKSDLIARWLNYRHEVWTTGFVDRLEQKRAQGAEVIDAVFEALSDWMTETNFRGCGFINTHAESNELTDEHRDIIRNHKRSLGHYLATLTPDGTALAVLVDGAIVQASIFRTTEPIDSARRAALALYSSTST